METNRRRVSGEVTAGEGDDFPVYDINFAEAEDSAGN